MSFFRLRAINRKTTFQDSFPFEGEKKRERKKREEKEIRGTKRGKKKKKGLLIFCFIVVGRTG